MTRSSSRPPAVVTRRGVLGAGAAGLALAACGQEAEPTAAPGSAAADPSTAPSAEPSAADEAIAPLEGGREVTIRTCVYANNHASSMLFWQQFAPEGVTVEVTPVTNTADILAGLEGGTLDFGLMSPYVPMLTQPTGGITSKVVAMVARQGFGLVGKAGTVESVADLAGKKIAVPPPGAQVLVLGLLLEEAGLALGTDVEGVPLGYADHVAALASGQVDAFMGSEPPCSQAVVDGTGVRLDGVYDTALGDLNTALWASSTILEDPEVVTLVTRLQKKAAEFMTPGGRERPRGVAPAARGQLRLRRGGVRGGPRHGRGPVAVRRGARGAVRGRGQGPGRDRRAAGRARLRGAVRPRVLGRLRPRVADVATQGLAEVARLEAAAGGFTSLRRARRRRGRRWLGLVLPLALLGVWQAAVSAGLRDRNRLPAPVDVLVALQEFFLTPSRPVLSGVIPFVGAGWQHLAASLERTAVSWAAAVLVGLLVGLALGLSRWFADLTDPLLNALRAVPLFAWLPLVIVQFGLTETSARVLVFVGALWPVLVSTADGVARVPRQHIETARMLGTPRGRMWQRVYLPSALPEIVTGLRLSLTLAWTCVIVGELTGITWGVGAMMFAARERGATDQIVVGILVFALVGYAADRLLRLATRRWVRWADT